LRTWRAERGRGKRIPDALWEAAAEAARVHGLSGTARALKLNYYDLQRRMRSGGELLGVGSPAPTFVELPGAALGSGGAERGTVELVQASGARLILRMGAARAADLLPVVEAFLRSGV
jgi:hypothetical protein